MKKNLQNSKRNIPGQASGPYKVPRRPKMPLKEVGTRILGVPWDPLGEPKINKK